MESINDCCRLCLKLTRAEYLTPLFKNNGSEESIALEWSRLLSFIYNIQGLPDKICSNCKAQAEWFLNFQRQCYDNDAILRLNQMKTMELEVHEQQDIKTLSNIYQEVENNLDNNGRQMQEGKEFECDPGAFEEYEDQITINHSKELLIEENPADFLEQELLVEGTGNKIMQSKSEVKILEYHLEEEPEQHDKMDYSTEDAPSYMNSNNCPICEKSFTNKYNMDTHRKKHENPKPFKCTFSGCEKKFATKERRNDHIKTIHENRIYRCPACNHTGRYRCNIANHIRMEHRGSGIQPLELEG